MLGRKRGSGRSKFVAFGIDRGHRFMSGVPGEGIAVGVGGREGLGMCLLGVPSTLCGWLNDCWREIAETTGRLMACAGETFLGAVSSALC